MGFTLIKKLTQQVTVEWRIFLFIFLYVILAGLVLQKIVLPLTPWHAGHGLLIGGDWLLFHDVALLHFEQVRELGWKAFELKPEGHGPSGFAALIYLLTGVIEPWILLPVNGAVYALAAVSLFRIIEALGGNRRVALYAILPMVLMPSFSMAWGQLHKDVWAIAGVLIILAFWARLFIIRQSGIWMPLLFLVFANGILWWMRPYTLQIIFVGQLLLLGLLILLLLKNRVYESLGLGLLAILITLIFWQFIKYNYSTRYTQPAQPVSDCKVWVNTLPVTFLDNKLSSLACTREGLMQASPNAKSNLDLNVNFTSALDVFAYVPRALQLGVWAPFPNMWFAEGTAQTSSLFRRVAALEMGVLYLSQLGIFFLVVLMFLRLNSINYFHKIGIIALLLFSIFWVLIYTMATGNIGTLYRIRFPVMILWMGLGILGWYQGWLYWRENRLIVHE